VRATPDSPFQLFAPWWRPGEELPVALATATPDGRPSLRMVLLKGFDAAGFTFFTNYDSRKGRELAANPRAALLFHRPGSQVRVAGRVERLPADASDAYWRSRPSASRRSAAASLQSRPIASRAELERRVAALPPEPERPDWWGGYRLLPDEFEFWEHREDRLHDRLAFQLEDGVWRQERLQP
jgi:pyridoxamine 5'-phosphate oxidase